MAMPMLARNTKGSTTDSRVSDMAARESTIYPLLRRLLKDGLLASSWRDSSEGLPPRKYYAITDSGREYLRRWLKTPAERDELRYETLLKLCFGKEQGAEQAKTHIEAFREKTEKELAYLLKAKQALTDCLDEDDTHRYYLLTVEFGIKAFRAYLEWCEEGEVLGVKEQGQ